MAAAGAAGASNLQYSVCIFCRLQGNRQQLVASPCGSCFCAFHLDCVKTYVRAEAISTVETAEFPCPSCGGLIRFSMTVPSNIDVVRQAREGMTNFCLALANWRFLALYFAFQMLGLLFFFACQVAFLASHDVSVVLAVLKFLSYLPEWVGPPESTRSLPRIPLFSTDPIIRPYSPEMIEVVELLRSSVCAFFHALAVLSYTIVITDGIHAVSMIWISIDMALFVFWMWRAVLNILVHYRRFKADVRISGVPE